MEKVRNLTITEYLAKAAQKRTVTLWGDKYEFEPYVCENELGDGLQLIAFGTLNNRPLYWLVLIDSNVDVDSEDFDYGEVLRLIEDECGQCLDMCKNCDEDKQIYCEYPVISWCGGYWTPIANFATGYENPKYDYL